MDVDGLRLQKDSKAIGPFVLAKHALSWFDILFTKAFMKAFRAPEANM